MSAEFWKHASIPFVAGLVGWGTNWAAIRLTFLPLEFVGLRPYLGWQGIIPSKAAKMARIFVEKTMFRLGTLQELFQSMEPEAIKESVYARVRERMPQLVDFKEMLVDTLEADRNLLNRLFLESGAAEFRFIVRSGLYFGFLFGLVQLTVWSLWKSWWVLPFFGLLVGAVTNWVAISIIFRPLHPTRVGPWTLQGLFLKRQKEVSAIWARLVTSEIVTLQRIVYTMVYGSRADRAHAMIRRHIQPIVDEVTRSMAPLAGLAVGQESLEGIRRNVGDKAVEVATEPFDHWPFNRDRGRLADLPSHEFQDLLRPCFQEDEIKLIVLVFGGTG